MTTAFIISCLAICAISLVTWTYRRKLRRSQLNVQQLEAALRQQQADHKQQIKKRALALRRAQLNEMRQMYRCAELGHQGVTLLHDLANHLTALTLEIENLQNTQPSNEINRAQQIIRYLEGMVKTTRERLHGRPSKHTFDIGKQLNDVIAYLRYRAAKAGVIIDWRAPAYPLTYLGDPACLSQVVVILIHNAIDSYGSQPPASAEERRVVVMVQRSNSRILIKVTDWGRGISKDKRRQLFRPLHSSKKAGFGLGLFIAKQTIENDFSGNITLSPRTDCTEFTISLPQAKSNNTHSHPRTHH